MSRGRQNDDKRGLVYSLAHVILPFADVVPADAIRASLARFQRGGRGDVPEEWLGFHDETAEVDALHQANFTFTKDGGLRLEGGESWDLNTSAVTREMDRRGIKQWSICFADLEPDLVRFAERFLRPFERHPVSGGLGHWRNPLGQWDWWELGGRFDGSITGQGRRLGRGRSSVSSGPSKGRDMLKEIQDAVGAALGQQPIDEIDLLTDDNIELVSRLCDDLVRNDSSSLPGALVMPPGSIDDSLRWISNWPKLGPPDAIASLGVKEDTDWRTVVRTSYNRFSDHWAAGVAFHH